MVTERKSAYRSFVTLALPNALDDWNIDERVKSGKDGKDWSRIFRDFWRDICHFCRIAAKVVIFNSVNSKVTGPNLTIIIHNSQKFMPFNLLKS